MLKYMPKCYDKASKMSPARRCRIANKVLKTFPRMTKEDQFVIEYMLLIGEIYAG